MRRSAPSEVEGSHLVACPNCGALNGKTATLCWKCEAGLAGASTDESAPSLPTFEPIAPDLQSAKPETPAVVPENGAPPPDLAGLLARSRSFAARTEAVRRKRRKMISSATVVVGAAVAVSAYFISRQGAVGDMMWLPVGGTDVTGRGSPAEVGSRVDTKAESLGKAPAASMPGPAATNARATGPPPQSAERSVAALDRDPPGAVGAARGKASEKTELGANMPSRATPVAAARATTSKRGVSKRAVESPEAAAALARSRTAPAGTLIEQPPPHPGPCTPAIAALGLCTPEPTQRRE
jgi:hypothetical protein